MNHDKTFKGCRITVTQTCDATWDTLTRTPVPGIRQCDTCAKEVFLCENEAQAEYMAAMGRCIAIATSAPKRRRSRSSIDTPMAIGEPVSPHDNPFSGGRSNRGRRPR